MSGQEFQLDLQLFEELHLYLRQYLPLVPPRISLARLTHVLDVGCGLNVWGKDLFRDMVEQAGFDLLDDVQIEGIDFHPGIVRRANRHVRAGREHVTAIVGDMFNLPANFEDRYDLVHARFLSPFVAPHAWPILFKELVRVCRPGGWVIWCEPGLPTKSERTSAWNQLLDWIEQAVEQMGGSPHIASSMEDVFQHIDSLHKIEIQKIVLPLQTARQGILTIEEVHILHCKLIALQSPLQAAGVTSRRLLERGLKKVEEEFQMRRVSASQWEWCTLSGKKL